MCRTSQREHLLFPAKGQIRSLLGVVFLLLVFFPGLSVSTALGDQIPKQSDWTDWGPILSNGPAGSWDVRLHGMISPCTVVKKNGTYFLYYIGADGDRSTDGGPRHRALGVATSKDGIHFTKYSGNPIITYLPHGNEEEGIFSAGATLDTNGEIVLYYGAMDAGNSHSEQVDGDVRVAVSTNGFDFTDLGDTLSHADPSVWGYGDELFPIGTFQENGQWYVYYLAKMGSAVRWDLGLAWGPSRDHLPNSEPLLTPTTDIIGGGDPVDLGRDQIALPLIMSFDARNVEVRTAPKSLPGDLSAPVATYGFGSARGHATTFLDRDANTWFMYYRKAKGNTIFVRTVQTEGEEEAPSDHVIIWLEAEEGYLNPPMEMSWDGSASSGEYIWVPDGKGDVFDSDSQQAGYTEYIFGVPRTGYYTIWCRRLSNNAGADSFFVSVDDGAYVLWDTRITKTWAWGQLSNRGGPAPVLFHLEAGEHTLLIKQREDGTKLDKILVTNDLNYVPQGLEGENLPPSPPVGLTVTSD